MPIKKELPRQCFKTAAAWRRWLAKQHGTSPGLWLQLAKKESGITSITYAEALDEALCYGWIDGQKQKFDQEYWLQKFTPRRRNSLWSQVNRQKVLALIEQGRMQPAGLAVIEEAKANGRWDAAYSSSSQSEAPADLVAALAANPDAAAFFETLDRRNRYAIYFRLQTVRRAETRAAKVATFVAMLSRGETLYPPGKRGL